MIKLLGTRFGEIEIEEGNEIVFAQGLFGFPDARRYALLPPGRGRVAWLQSLEVPGLAFPVVEGAAFGADYPHPPVAQLASDAGLAAREVAVLVIVAAIKDQGLVANLLAPLVIDMETRTGAQIVLDPQMYSAATPLRPVSPAPAGPPRAEVEKQAASPSAT